MAQFLSAARRYWWRTKAASKQALLFALQGLGIGAVYWQLRGRRKSTILCYHTASDAPLPAYPNNVMPVATFERHMEYLRRHRTVVSLDQCVDRLRSGSQTTGGFVAITFDDGYKSCLDTVAPILARHGFAATFFVSPGFIDRREPKWDDWLYFAMKPFKKHTLRAGKGEVERLIQQLEPPNGERSGLKEACAASLLTWEDAKALRDMGHSVQSHGLNHYFLSAQETADQEVELAESKRRLETVLGGEVSYVAYPFGWPDSYTAETQMLARRAGYTAAFTGERGYVEDAPDAFAIRRMTIGRDTPFWMFKLMLSGLYF